MAGANVGAVLGCLLGRWDGTGSGEFPTLDSFTYREQLDMNECGGSVVHYVQQTWRLVDGVEVGSHIETGFINVREDNSVEWLNAQGSDRVEVLQGRWTFTNDVASIDVESVVFAHDDRMIRSWRNMTINGHELSYVMGMATNTVPHGAMHLTAMLQRR
jgi:hypothetical protein